MEQFQKIKFFYYFFIILLTSCGKPTVVEISLPGDSDLSCKELDLKVMEAQKIKREAVIASDQTGANIARVAFYWPAWAMTLHNADKAIAAADDRTFHLYLSVSWPYLVYEIPEVLYLILNLLKAFYLYFLLS